MSAKSLPRRVLNRALHHLARWVPGATTIRPFLHRLRGVKIHGRVWIGDDVYLESEYPENIELQEGAALSMRCMVLAHTHGEGSVTIGRRAFIGPMAVVACTAGRTITIGDGAVITIGAIVSTSVPAHTVFSPPRSKAVAMARVPFCGSSLDEFLAGLEPLKKDTAK